MIFRVLCYDGPPAPCEGDDVNFPYEELEATSEVDAIQKLLDRGVGHPVVWDAI